MNHAVPEEEQEERVTVGSRFLFALEAALVGGAAGYVIADVAKLAVPLKLLAWAIGAMAFVLLWAFVPSRWNKAKFRHPPWHFWLLSALVIVWIGEEVWRWRGEH